MKNFQILQQKYLVNTYPDRGKVFVRGEGVFLYDTAGNPYLDMMSNYGVNLFGYNHSLITEALIEQLQRLTTLHSSFNSDVRAQAAAKLVRRCGGDLAKVYFANSGAEAVEAALKFAVLATGNKRFVACRSGYHGKTLGALSTSDTAKYTAPFRPLLWEFDHVGYGDAAQLDAALDGSEAAFILEPIQGESGVNTPDAGYLRKVREICTHRGVLMIVDEIQTGLGRTGHFLACHAEDVRPDILCLGKGLAGGIPVGAVLVGSQVAESIPRSIHTSTFGGNPLACAGIEAVLELLDDEILSKVRAAGDTFMRKLSEIDSGVVKAVRGRGLMVGIVVPGKQTEILKALQRERLLAAPAGTDVVRFLPPLILTHDHIETAASTLSRVLKAA
jgi:acetylornithine/succinyldiaminopimelate/putrescine aminotransferase